MQNNSTLHDCCAIQELLSTPDAVSNSIFISLNATECETEEDILMADSFTVTNNFSPVELQIFPNPVTNNLQVFHKDYNLYLTLFNTNGKIINSGILPQQKQLDFSELELGVYYLKIDQYGVSSTRKILKMPRS
ncbi:MAG: hypothetical protein ACI9XO_002981 [Paraglaciecola sp.]|jgi:hypothetical protein